MQPDGVKTSSEYSKGCIPCMPDEEDKNSYDDQYYTNNRDMLKLGFNYHSDGNKIHNHRNGNR